MAVNEDCECVYKAWLGMDQRKIGCVESKEKEERILRILCDEFVGALVVNHLQDGFVIVHYCSSHS